MASNTPAKFKRLYPRFCGNMNFPDVDLDSIPMRSEWWLVKFIEDAYDEAMAECNKNNITNRPIRKTVLDLGAMDAFPFVVKRLMEKRFSTLEIMQAIILEFLVTLHVYLEKEVKVLHEHIAHPSSEYVVNGKRTTLFAKFLSEEYDTSFVALYLHNREATQLHFSIRLTNLVSPRIWLDLVEEDLEGNADVDVVGGIGNTKGKHNKEVYIATNNITTNRSGHKNTKQRQENTGEILKNSAVAITGATTTTNATAAKGTPLKLPKFMIFSQDTAVSEVSLPCIDLQVLPLIFQVLFVGFSSESKIYLAEKMLETTAKHTFATKGQLNEYPVPVYFNTTQENKRQEDNALINELKESYHVISTVEDYIKHKNPYKDLKMIPMSILFLTLIDEWKKVPTDAKDKFMGRDEATEQLRVLNVIYDKDSLMMKELAESIKQAQMQLTLCTSNLMKLEKFQKRLERKWADDQATPEELDELTNVRVSVTEARVAK